MHPLLLNTEESEGAEGLPLYNTLLLVKGRGFTFNMMEILIVHSSHLHSGLWICYTLPYGYFINWFTQTVHTRMFTTVKCCMILNHAQMHFTVYITTIRTII